MLALEAAFDIEFPDAMLKRTRLPERQLDQRGARDARGRGVTPRAIDRDQAFLDGDPADRRRRRRARTPTDVDRDARFPAETVDALREEGALSAFVPDRARRRRGLASRRRRPRASSSAAAAAPAAMVFAMHQIQVASHRAPPRRGALVRGLPARPRPRAAADRVGDVRGRDRRRHRPLDRGGDARATTAASPSRSRRRPCRTAPTPTTCSRPCAATPTPSPATRSSCSRSATRRRSSRSGTWDPLGHARHVLAGLHRPRRASRPSRCCRRPFSTVAAESMVPVSHILWSHLWLGIATDAFDRARAFVRASAKQRPDQPRRSAQRLSHLMSELSLLRAEVGSGLRDFIEASDDADRERLAHDGHDPALQQPQDRRLRAGAARSARARSACAGSSATRTTRRSASAATCATRCRPR